MQNTTRILFICQHISLLTSILYKMFAKTPFSNYTIIWFPGWPGTADV